LGEIPLGKPIITGSGYRTLLVSEHLIPKSHADNISMGLRACSDFYSEVDYTESYKLYGLDGLESLIRQAIIVNKINVVVVLLGIAKLIYPEFLNSIRQRQKVKVIIIFPDSEHCFESHDRYYAQCADLSWLLMPGMLGTFKLYGFECASGLGLDPTLYRKHELPKDIDVSFVGGLYRANRAEYVNYLESNGINIIVAGYGNLGQSLTPQEMNELICRSKIHLNFTGVVSDDKAIHARIKQCKGRNIEIPFLGTFMLSEYAPGLETLFVDGSEYIFFRTKEELLEKVRYYLLHDAEREAIAAQGHRRATINYTSQIVAQRMLVHLDQITLYGQNMPIFDRQFLKEFCSVRFYWLGWFLSILSWRNAYAELLLIFKLKAIAPLSATKCFARGCLHALRYRSAA
jgi:hypothetical protein